MKTVLALLSAVAALSAPPQHIEKPPLAQSVPIIISVAPSARHADGNYVIEGSADELYGELKSKLDERFARMFELKAELDGAQSELSAKWEEYHALNERYNRELKKIIAVWTMQSSVK